MPSTRSRDEHVAELADGRISEDAFEVGLRERDQRGQEACEPANRGDHDLRVRRVAEQRRAAGDQVDAGRHHRRRVDEGRDRRRAFHRVGQPDVERELGRLADRADEEEQTRRRQHRRRQRLRLLEDNLKFERIGMRPENQDAEKEPDVAEPGHEERLASRRRRTGFGEPEADEQIAADADPLPARVEEQEVVGEDQRRHRREEQAHLAEEARIARIAAHVAGREDRDQGTDERHGAEHHAREPVGPHREPRLDVAGLEPDEAFLQQDLVLHAADREQGPERQDARGSRAEDARPVALPAQHRLAEQQDDEAAEERTERNEPQQRLVIHGSSRGASWWSARRRRGRASDRRPAPAARGSGRHRRSPPAPARAGLARG